MPLFSSIQTPASRKIVSVGIFAFLLGTMHFASTVAYDQIQMEQILLVDPERDLGERLLDIDLKLMKADLCLQWSAMLAPLVSDAIVIWRARVLHGRRWVTICLVPPWCAVAGLATTLAFLVMISNFTTWEHFTGGDCDNACRLIGNRFWTHRQVLRRALEGKTGATYGERVLAIFLESGLAYAILQIVLIGSVFNTSKGAPSVGFSAALFQLYGQLSALYPLCVTILVRIQGSIMDDSGFQYDSGGSSFPRAQDPNSPLRSLPHHITFQPHADAVELESGLEWPTPRPKTPSRDRLASGTSTPVLRVQVKTEVEES
ncbi:hypothetical protein DL96DRAFT_1791227 [Flagelloscypha sp. PMI_526]|nr:hypothetical protein DL96DRAFT_1791227 [Flagelloscypha sp. PMI_526]